VINLVRCPPTPRSVAIVLCVFTGVLGLAAPGLAQRARSAADATVFIRLVGSVQAAVEGTFESARWDQVEIGSGSGFVISPYGYVLTNHHVVANEDLSFRVDGKRVKVTLKTSRIDVCFPPEAAAARSLQAPCFHATVAASDPVLDLAVLFISVPGLPYVAMGDSDAVRVGLPVDSLGYPFGRELELGQATASDIVPEVSTSAATISALRAGDGGERRFLQVGGSLNPGNSGGPVVDRDGFAVGVIRMKLTAADGIGFAIPINQVKDFLEANGLDQNLPSRRLRLGPAQSFDGKGIRLRLPEGFTDASQFRTRVETEAKPAEIALRIDRVFSPLGAKQIDQTLTTTETFERFSISSSESRFSAQPDAGRLLLGHASGSSADDKEELRMESAVLELGAEKLVARYVGPAEQMAFNASILRASLAGLSGDRLLTAELQSVDALKWSSRADDPVAMPGGWVVEQGGPAPCQGLPPPVSAVSTSPAGDFTIVLRASVWPTEIPLERAAAACSSRRGELGDSSYATAVEWLGVPYVIEGVFARVGSRTVQIEVLAPARKNALARALLAQSLKRTTEAHAQASGPAGDR
jgi:S1-C subfamily serine protease